MNEEVRWDDLRCWFGTQYYSNIYIGRKWLKEPLCWSNPITLPKTWNFNAEVFL